MILTIWRHGTAEEGVTDHLRELTSAGCDDVGFGCHQFHQACSIRNIPPISTILYSPLVRTTQTAGIIAGASKPAKLQAEGALEPGSRLSAVEEVIKRLDAADSNEKHLLLVSHQPLVSRIVDHYLGESGSVPPLPPGGLATLLLDVAAPGGAKLLFWAFPPEFEAGV
jgi:phosphohistidine phosphatase